MSKKIIPPEDSDLFRQAVGPVQAVKSDKIVLENTGKPKPKPYPKVQQVDLEEQLQVTSSPDLENLSHEDSLGFLAPGLQKNVLKKLRRLHYGLHAEIDLHGLNSHDAKHQLLAFLHDCVEGGCRCVRIIHGKGYRSVDQHPVLKNNVNLWLRQHRDVQAFCSATPQEGGAGAVFVLLQLAEKYGYQEDGGV
ncbi:MAG: Smr/MutS family protein [Methylococcaceae bacterium]